MDPDLSLIVEYINQNRATYSRYAIDLQLRSAGYEQAAIDAAWQQIGGPAVAEPETMSPEQQRPRPVVSYPVFWLVLVGFVVGVFLIPFAVNQLAYSVSGQYVGGGALPIYLWLGMSVGALIGGAVLLRRNRPVGMGLLVGAVLAFVIPVVALCVFFGACLILLSNGGRGL